MSEVQRNSTTPPTKTTPTDVVKQPPLVDAAPPKLHLLVCTVCEHPICDASDILGDKAEVNPEYGFAYKFEGMLNICDSSSEDDDDDAEAVKAATATSAVGDGEAPPVQKAPYCYRIQHKSYATLQRRTTGSDRAVQNADDNLLISLAEGVISRIHGGQYGDGDTIASPEELLLPERMSEVCSDQRVDVVRLKERVSDFGVRHEVLSTQSEYRLASMELPDSATLNDGTSVSSFIQPLSTSAKTSAGAATTSTNPTSQDSSSAAISTSATDKAGIHFVMSYEDVMSGSAEWFPGYVVHNECFCASCGAPVGYRFVPKPNIKWNNSKNAPGRTPGRTAEEDALVAKFWKDCNDICEGDQQAAALEQEKKSQKSQTEEAGVEPMNMDAILYGENDMGDEVVGKESFVGILLSTVKQREWGVRQFARRTVLSRVHTMFDALSLSRQAKSDWATMDCLADFALTQLEARVNGVGPTRTDFIETMPCALRTIMGLLSSTLPLDPVTAAPRGTSHHHAQFLSQAERGRVGRASPPTNTGAEGAAESFARGEVDTTPSTPSVAADTAATIRWGQHLRSQLAADSLHHFTRIGREPLLFTSMIARFMEDGGSAALEATAAAQSSSTDANITRILRDTQDQTRAINRLNANRHESAQSDSSPYLLAAAAQLMESTKRHLIDVTVKERIAGYKQQAKLIQQLVDKLKEQNSVLVDLVASQRIKMKANESQTKMFEEIIEAHKTQLGTYDRHIKFQDELAKTLREQLKCSSSEIEEQQKIMKSQNDTITTQNEQMSMLRKICSELTTETSPIYRRAPVQPACLEGTAEYLPDTIDVSSLRRNAPKNKEEQERRDELIARSLERQEKLAYLKSLLQQKEAISASLSCNAAPQRHHSTPSAAATASSSNTARAPASTTTSSAPSSGVTSPRGDEASPPSMSPEKKE